MIKTNPRLGALLSPFPKSILVETPPGMARAVSCPFLILRQRTLHFVASKVRRREGCCCPARGSRAPLCAQPRVFIAPARLRALSGLVVVAGGGRQRPCY